MSNRGFQLLTLNFCLLTLGLISGARNHRQPRILRESRIRGREFTHIKHRPAPRLDPPRMCTIRAQPHTEALSIRVVLCMHSPSITFRARDSDARTCPTSGSVSLTVAKRQGFDFL